MFQIDFSFFICYYLIGILIVFFSWGSWHSTRKTRMLAARDNVRQCMICLYVYFDARGADISTCPQCGSFNKKAGKHGG